MFTLNGKTTLVNYSKHAKVLESGKFHMFARKFATRMKVNKLLSRLSFMKAARTVMYDNFR